MNDENRLDHRGHAIWWGITGDPRRSVPVLTIHGGPGLTHDYLEPLEALAAERAVVFYDQYGSGRSDRAQDPAEYTVSGFVDELARVREVLGLDRVHLFAHSYGGPLALEYVLRHPASGVASLTLSNTFGSTEGLVRGWHRRIAELEPEQAEALRAGPADPGYGDALGAFVQRFVLPGEPPAALMRSQVAMGAEVYARMHGSSWFEPDGEWSSWDAADRLARVDVPTLVIGGVRDQCAPELAEELAQGIPGAELRILDAGHLPFVEQPHTYLRLVADFFTRAEQAGG